jgi:hypothetical protein
MKDGDDDELLKNLKTEPAEGSLPSVKDVPDDSTYLIPARTRSGRVVKSPWRLNM